MIKKFNSSPEKRRLLKVKGSKKKRLCRHMIDIWNKTIEHKLYPENKTSLTAKREERFILFLEEILGTGISWETYCGLIANYGFSGKMTLNWALIPDNARKILASVTDETSGSLEALKHIPWGEFFEDIKKKCQKSPYGAQWFQISQHLAKRLGQRIYKIWFSHASLAEFTGNAVTIRLDSAFKRDYILAYFFLDLVYAIQAAYPPVNQIDFQVNLPRE